MRRPSRAFVREFVSDAFIAAGAIAIATGAYQFHPSVGLAVGGVLAVAIGFMLALGGR